MGDCDCSRYRGLDDLYENFLDTLYGSRFGGYSGYYGEYF